MLSNDEKKLLNSLLEGTCQPEDFIKLEMLKEQGYVKGRYQITQKAKELLNE